MVKHNKTEESIEEFLYYLKNYDKPNRVLFVEGLLNNYRVTKSQGKLKWF